MRGFQIDRMDLKKLRWFQPRFSLPSSTLLLLSRLRFSPVAEIKWNDSSWLELLQMCWTMKRFIVIMLLWKE